jgi:hypothetical protein
MYHLSIHQPLHSETEVTQVTQNPVLSMRCLLRWAQQSGFSEALWNIIPITKNFNPSILPVARRVKLLKLGDQHILNFAVGDATDECRDEIHFQLRLIQVQSFEDFVGVIIVSLEVIRPLGESGKAERLNFCRVRFDWGFHRTISCSVSTASHWAASDSGLRTSTGGLLSLAIWNSVASGWFLIDRA